MDLLELIFDCELTVQRAKANYVANKKLSACTELGELSCVIQDNLVMTGVTDEAPEHVESTDNKAIDADLQDSARAPEQPAKGTKIETTCGTTEILEAPTGPKEVIVNETTKQSTPAALALDGPEKVKADETPADCADDAYYPDQQTDNPDE